VRSIPEPIGERQQRFSAWQESARKDIERAFGVLQTKFQVLARPMLQLNLIQIGNKVATYLILHNMCVSGSAVESWEM
jgi:Plant transposon protein